LEPPAATDSEVEWQLDAQDLRPVARWLEHAQHNGGVEGISIGRGGTTTHLDTYADTDDRRLDRAGYSVRVRRATRGPTAEATLKALGQFRADALRIRRELSEEIDVDEPEAIAQAAGPVAQRVRALIGPRKLLPLFTVQTRRRAYPLAADGVPSGELLLDESTIRSPDGGVLGRLRRVEAEVPESAVPAVGALVSALQSACGLQPAVFSKYEAALAASGSHRTEPESFGTTTITPQDTIGQVALAVLRRQFAALRASEPGARLGDDIEELHDMRVASRRLRAAVSLFADVLPADAERLRPELAWLGSTIGAVRDLDVQLAELDDWAAGLPEADGAALEHLRSLLLEERAAARAAMLLALDTSRYERLVRRFGTMLRSRSGIRSAAARTVARQIVEQRHRAVRKRLKRINRGTDEPVEYHELRIAAKRFRYALEFLGDVYPGETEGVVRRTVALQDLLGAYQDAHVGSARLRELAASRSSELGADTIFAMGEIAERYRAAMERARPRLAPTAAKLDGKRWKRLRASMSAAETPSA
jgi:triphosphatase